MPVSSRKPVAAGRAATRRVVVVVVPPVDELDLIGPLQVLHSVNRLAGRTIYAVEVVTNADSLSMAGEGGVLTFEARQRLSDVRGRCDSVLVACGSSSRSVSRSLTAKQSRKN